LKDLWQNVSTRFISAQQVQPGTANFWAILYRWTPEIVFCHDLLKLGPAGRMGMTVKKTNRSHRIAYLVMLLLFAVALTTALVLAGETNPEGTKTSTLQTNTVPAARVVCLWGKSNA